MLWDTHMHCHFSGDSQAAPEDMITSARARGLAGICFTDHLDYDYREEPGEFLLDIPAYQQAIAALQEKYRNEFPVLWGIELGLQPHVADANRSVTAGFPFDFVIGSSHVVDGTDPYNPAYFERYSENAGIRRYFESILENIDVFNDFDVYGHLDYIVRYTPSKGQNYSYRQYADIIDEILQKLINMGKGIEINTGGLRRGLTHPNPTEEILARYHSLGGEILTLGADAHQPRDIAFGFETLPEIIKAAGFSYYTVFQNRQPHFIKL